MCSDDLTSELSWARRAGPGREGVLVVDPFSLSAIGTAGLGQVFKFLVDRANAALDRRAQKRADRDPSDIDAPGEDGNLATVQAPLRVLEVYQATGWPYAPTIST